MYRVHGLDQPRDCYIPMQRVHQAFNRVRINKDLAFYNPMRIMVNLSYRTEFFSLPELNLLERVETVYAGNMG